MITIYHNPRCKKSRAGLKYLEEQNVDFQIRQYLKDPLSEKELSILLTKMHAEPAELIRKQEDYYKKDLKGKNFGKEEWIKIMTENPKLIQRPVVEKEHKAVLAQPPEKIDELLK